LRTLKCDPSIFLWRNCRKGWECQSLWLVIGSGLPECGSHFTTILSGLMMIVKPYSKDTIYAFCTFFASPSDDRMVSIARCMSCCSTSSRTFSIRDLFSLLLKNTVSYYMYSIYPLIPSHPFPQIACN
jgi:hypothetical protein